MKKTLLLGLFVGLGLLILFLLMLFQRETPKNIAIENAKKTGSETSQTYPKESSKVVPAKPGEIIPGTNVNRQPLQPQESPSKEMTELYVKELGGVTGTSIDFGFVFIDGGYLDAPYIVSRKGLGIFVNDVFVKKSAVQWPPVDMRVKEDPGFPSLDGITENTTFDEFTKKCWAQLAPKCRYLHQTLTQDVAIQKIKEYYESLPFVKSVTFEPPVDLIIETMHGKKIPIDYGPPPITWMEPPPPKEDVIEEIESDYKRIEEDLKRGRCYFFFSKERELTFAPDKVNNDLPETIDILKSDMPSEYKIEDLQDVGLLPEYWTHSYETLFPQFSATPQLEERLLAIKQSRKDTPRKRPYTGYDSARLTAIISTKMRELGRELTFEEQQQLEKEYFKQKDEAKRQRREQHKQKSNENR